MSEPLEFRALQALQAALQGVAGAGYYYDLAASAVKLDPDQGVDELLEAFGPRPYVILEVTPDRWAYNYGADQVKVVLPVTVHWVHEPTRTSDQMLGEPESAHDADRLQVFWRGCADVERAIGRDVHLGGLVTDTRILNRRWVPSEQDSQRIWAAIETEITLHRTYGQP